MCRALLMAFVRRLGFKLLFISLLVITIGVLLLSTTTYVMRMIFSILLLVGFNQLFSGLSFM